MLFMLLLCIYYSVFTIIFNEQVHVIVYQTLTVNTYEIKKISILKLKSLHNPRIFTQPIKIYIA